MEENTKLKKGAWTSEEDELLSGFITTHGLCTWSKLAIRAGLNRCGKSCRLRWMNYLRPDLKRGQFTKEDEDLIRDLYEKYGTSWSKIAASLPGRSDNEIKNYWHTYLKEKFRKRTKRKKAKSVTKPFQLDNKAFVVLESSSTTCSVSTQKFSNFSFVADKQHSEADAIVWPGLVKLETKPNSDGEHEEDITSVVDFPVSPQKSDDFSPLSIDDYVIENLDTDDTAMWPEVSIEHGRNYWNDQFKIDEEVPIRQIQATNQMGMLPEQNLEFDVNCWNENMGFVYDMV